jgi:bile acid:Na+ symporter, BASS family
MLLLLLMISGTVLAVAAPQSVLWMTGGLKPAFAVTMFFVGTLVKEAEIVAFKQTPIRPVVGLLGQYTIMPLLGLLIASLFDDPMIRAGIILVGCMPGAMASNVMTVLLKGDLVLSVIMTTLATLACPVVIALWLPLLTGRTVDLPIGAMVWDAAWMVALPVLLGAVLRNRFGARLPAFWDRGATIIAALAILMIVLVVAAANRERLLDMGPSLAAAMVGFNLAAYLVAFGVGKLLRWPKKQRRTFVIEVGMQNAGLGSVLALSHLGPAGAAPSAFYTGLCVVTAGAALPLFQKMRPSRKKQLA